MEKYNAERRLETFRMDNMPIIEYRPVPTKLPASWFKDYKRNCVKFITNLTDSIEELVMLNIGQDDFMALLMGQKIPQNLSIRFKIPLIWGGENSPENMFMCKTFPHAQNLDRFIIEQAGEKTIWLPSPAKKIYLSTHDISGSDGGNTTEDRLSQMAAQIMASRGKE